MASYNTDQFGIERLTAEIATLKQQVSELRTLQQSSANGIQTLATPTGDPLEIDGVVAAGASLNLTFQIIPASHLLTTWNMFMTPYIDLPAYPTLDASYGLPIGFNLSTGAKKMTVTWWGDWGYSDDTTGMRTYRVNVQNNDSASHHIYVVGKFYGPYLQASTGI